MKRSPLRRKYAIYFALASACVLVTSGVLAETCECEAALFPWVIVGFPSVILLVLSSFAGGWMWPDSMSDGEWIVLFVFLMIPSVCFWAGMGWIVGRSVDKRKQDQTDTCSGDRPSDDSSNA
jgi:hypothetical protein